MSEVIWADIPHLKGYEASTNGDIRNKKTGTIVKPYVDPKQEYGRITIQKNRHKQKYMAHALIMLTFCGPKPEGCEIDHINTNRLDNRLENLRYVSPEENRNNPNTVKNVRIGTVKMMVTKGFISAEEGERRIKEIMGQYGD